MIYKKEISDKIIGLAIEVHKKSWKWFSRKGIRKCYDA